MGDVNGTRFHLLLGERDWAPLLAPGSGLTFDAERSGVGLEPQIFRFSTPPGDRPPRLEDRRGAARDRYGNWYWIGADEREIRFLPPGAAASERFWPVLQQSVCPPAPRSGFRPLAPLPAAEAPRLRGLTVTCDHYLVAGVLDPPGLLVFDLHAGGPPLGMLPWPAGDRFEPLDMAALPGGGVAVLDRPLDPAGLGPAGPPRLWTLDRHLRVLGEPEPGVDEEDDFAPHGRTPRRRAGRPRPRGTVLAPGSPAEPLHAIALEALPDGSVLILETRPGEGWSRLHRLRCGRFLGPEVVLDRALEGAAEEGTAGLAAFDLAFVRAAPPPDPAAPRQVRGTLFLGGADGNQSFAFSLEAGGEALRLTLQRSYHPMRRAGGRGLVAGGGPEGGAHYDSGERWLPLAEAPRPRFLTEGSLTTAPLDGREPECVWHRLLLDACIPEGPAVAGESRAAERPDLLFGLPWEREPDPYLRAGGPELPYIRVFTREELRRGRTGGIGTWELLFQRARGRWLQLRLTFAGNRRATPRVRALRAWYPRFSYLKEYLPPLYRADEASASFLDRYLANVEGIFTALEGRIEQAQELWDPEASEYLEWLAGWLGAELDPAWDAARQRLFLRHAPELFQQRGTVAGLVRMLRLALDACADDGLFLEDVTDPRVAAARRSVRVVESFLTRGQPGVTVGDPEELELPRLVPAGEAWTPASGAGPLHQRWRDYLRRVYPPAPGVTPETAALNEAWGTSYGSFAEIDLSPVLPAQGVKREDWLRFTRWEIGFTYAPAGAADAPAWHAFLAQRYRRVTELHRAWALTGPAVPASFAGVPLPAALPVSGAPLADWIRFVSTALPLRRNAHRFTVLVPVAVDEDAAARQGRLELVRRVVDREKPAHTRFEVREFWALFRVGQARLGLDTAIDQGGRLLPLSLGGAYLGESYLPPSHPWGEPDRLVAGRDRVGAASPAATGPQENPR